ncbi:PIR Superfamily Protein, partial [Plasmodium ovale curtisi]
MSEDTVDQALKLLEEDSTLKENSNLLKFNEKFSDVINNVYDTYKTCSNLRDDRDKDICKIDEKIKQSLSKSVKEVNPVVIDNRKQCEYLLYWISDKIGECKNNISCMVWLYKKFDSFWKGSSCCEKNDKDECKEKVVKEIDMELLKKKKGLYIFLEYYNKIKNILKEVIHEEKNTYCKYVKHMFDLYYFMDNEVNVHIRKKYEKELKYFQQTFKDSDELSNLKTECNYSHLYATLHREEYNRNLSLQSNEERFMPITVDVSESRERALGGMDSILTDEPTYKLYKEFDKEEDDTKIKEYCEKHFTEKKAYSEESIKLCKNIVKNFNKLYEFESTIKSGERCLHYQNWVYREIRKMIITKSYYGYIEDIIKDFLDLQNKKITPKSDTKAFCHYYYIFKDLIELNVKLEEKDLHDYFKYYASLEKQISRDTTNKEKYRDYLNYISILYIRHKDGWGCCDESYGVDPLCRHYLKCEDEYNPSYLLSVLNGKPEEHYKQKKENFPIVLYGEEQLRNKLKEEDVMRIQYGRCTNVYDPKDKKKIFGRRCDYRASRDHFDKIHSNLTNPKNNDAPKVTISISSLPVNLNNPSDISNTEANESNPSHFKIGTSVALALGGIFISFLYYK